jgi:hypothetical protein
MSTSSHAVTDGVRSTVTSNTITVRKNSGADVGTEARLNLIEGANITLTVADDAGDGEIDVTINSAGGAAAGFVKMFYPAVDPDVVYGTYAGIEMPDLADTIVYHTFMIPSDLVTITRAVVIVLSAGDGNLYWNCDTDFAALCSNADFEENTDTIAATATAVDIEQLECINIAAALTGAAGLDLVGLKFTRQGSHANDTIGKEVIYLGVLIEGTT